MLSTGIMYQILRVHGIRAKTWSLPTHKDTHPQEGHIIHSFPNTSMSWRSIIQPFKSMGPISFKPQHYHK